MSSNKINIFKILVIFSVSLYFISCASIPESVDVDNDYCSTEYPILLVHGIGVRDEMVSITTWGDVTECLEERGAVVYKSHQNAFATHQVNGKLIKETILEIIKSTNCQKINIIAHSKGGLEARYAITAEGMDKYVASLTTISTPHHGSIMVEQELDDPEILLNVKTGLYNLYGLLLGDKHPDSLGALRQLTRDYLKIFNENIPDRDGVYYQSYASVISDHYVHPYFRKIRSLIFPEAGENDGVISVASSKWGNFRGILPGDISHLDIVGLTEVTGNEKFDYCNFFGEMVHDLKERGF